MCLGSGNNDLSWRNCSFFHNEDSEEVGKILGTISRVILRSSLVYCLLGMEILMPRFCGGMWKKAGRREEGSCCAGGFHSVVSASAVPL